MKNSVKQVRVCLEEIADVLDKFRDEIVKDVCSTETKNHSFEVQHRGIGINFEFGEKIQRSDDNITYYLKDDKLIGCTIVRRTEFNNAEITMIMMEERFKEEEL